MEETTNPILEYAKSQYKDRCYIISEKVDSHENLKLNNKEYLAFSFEKFKKIKLLIGESKLFFNTTNFLLCFDKNYKGDLLEPRSAVVITSQESSFLIDLINKNITIYEDEDSNCIIQVKKIDSDILKIISEDITVDSYPYISYEIKSDNNFVDLSFFIHCIEKLQIIKLQVEKEDLIGTFNRYGTLLSDNINNIANIYTMKAENSLLYVTEGTICKINKLDNKIFFNILDITKRKVTWRTCKLNLISLLKKEYVILDIPDYMYYNGLLFNKDFELQEESLEEYDKLENLKIILEDTQNILETITVDNSSNIEIVRANREIIQTLYNELKESKYYSSNLLLSYNGKLMMSAEVFKTVNTTIDNIEFVESVLNEK